MIRGTSSASALHRQLEGAGETDDEGDVLGAGAPALLLVAAEQERSAAGAATDVEGADALGCVQLVAGEREQIDMSETTPRRSIGSLPTVWVASVWKTIDGSVSLVMRDSSSTGKMTPVSLLACITETSRVSGRRARTNSVVSIRPWVSTGTKSTSKPRRSRSLPTSKMAGCSTAVVMMWRRSGLAAMVPNTAVLLLSEAQDVKRISGGGRCRAIWRSLSGSVDGICGTARRLVHRARVEVLAREVGHHRLDHLGCHLGRSRCCRDKLRSRFLRLHPASLLFQRIVGSNAQNAGVTHPQRF